MLKYSVATGSEGPMQLHKVSASGLLVLCCPQLENLLTLPEQLNYIHQVDKVERL